MYKNPAFQMFLMATLDRYWARKPDMRWQAGVDKMLIVLVGTGTSPDVGASLNPDDTNLLFNATTIPSAPMFAALNEQDLFCRVFGQCCAGDSLDREVGDLMRSDGPLAGQHKLFCYACYNAELTRESLTALGCNDIKPEVVQKLDSIAGISDLQKVGRKVAELKVDAKHFAGFPPA